MTALLALVLAAAAAGPQVAAAPEVTAIERAAEQVVRAAAEKRTPASTSVAVHVSSAETSELGRAVQTVLVSRLTRAGFRRVLPILEGSAFDAEERARDLAADVLVRLTVRLDGAELVLGGDLVPTWVNFWAGSDPSRAPGGAVLTARALTDAEVLTLAHVPMQIPDEKPAVASRFELAQLGKVPERILALAAGDLDGDGLPELAALGVASVIVFGTDGSVVARREHSNLPLSGRPPREPFGGLAIGPFGGERPRLAAFFAGRARGELLELREGALEPVAAFDELPICSGPQGVAVGSLVAGRAEISRAVRIEGGVRVELAFAPVSVVASARAEGPAFLALGADGAAALLDASLAPIERPLPVLGAAAALGDLDGDGATDLVATSPVLSGDRVRVLRADEPSKQLFASEPLAGMVSAAVAVDLDHDGRDEAVLAHLEPDGSTTLYVLGGEP